MFTGLIDHVGQIRRIRSLKTGIQLTIATTFNNLTSGESIAIDGMCLTVTTQEPGLFDVEVSQETLNRSIAKDYQVGINVNLERALKIGDAIGGHFVSGHVDQTAKITDIITHQAFRQSVIAGFSDEALTYLIYKGSICVNGVSLTINAIENNGIHVMLIPHTLNHTNLIHLQPNQSVNIEFDMMAKMVARQLQGVHYAKII
ncbi:MAG: riboflavin synthase subunit alpha [Coxiella sp. RIFCSPHIGHO2_12_FULL_42_15]|nr:MAG: riboflavin synthase subunit alpha [Coxiella sp. RIFCSPHIGHO2_12_FULL_42_15]